MQSPAVVARKLLVHEKITACVKQVCLQGVVCKVSNRKKKGWRNNLFSQKRFAVNI